MGEKVLVKSEQYNVKKLFRVLVIIGVILSVLVLVYAIWLNVNDYPAAYARYLEHQKANSCGYLYESWEECWTCERVGNHPSAIGFGFSQVDGEVWSISLCLVFLSILIGWLLYSWLRSYEMIVTNKRIYGKIAWGKRVDLPVDSVSATAMVPLFKGVSVSTSSGRIKFLVIKNADEVYAAINNLLIERQPEKEMPTAAAIISGQSDEVDLLKKYKELLDSGVITQEEFAAKKKQLLGL